MTSSAKADDYPLGRSEAETRRLMLQAQIYSPISRTFLRGAGITRGMRVLDVGSGAGDVSLLVADLVGPEGAVVGLEQNAEIVSIARERAESMGYSHVSYIEGDARDATLLKDFDAVVGRWVLMYAPDPVRMLGDLLSALKQGGIVAFQEIDFSFAPRSHPPAPLFDQIMSLIVPRPNLPGPDRHAGFNLHQQFVQAGLEEPQMSMAVPVGAGPVWPGYQYVTDTMRSLIPSLPTAVRDMANELDVSTLANRLREEALAYGAVYSLPPLVGAWARQ
ncbi:class I SAM-dependent methyltransferase [Streptomyces sp. NPDC052013]|uniref:class I SAM-dependent methyltransferase n=1 Tax=Streptomyces sp. NPDC052013 TaxID=3365679 RepID=UPI0037D3FD24